MQSQRTGVNAAAQQLFSLKASQRQKRLWQVFGDCVSRSLYLHNWRGSSKSLKACCMNRGTACQVSVMSGFTLHSLQAATASRP